MAILAVAMVVYFAVPEYDLRATLISAANLAAPVAVAVGIAWRRPSARVPWWALAGGLALIGIGTAIDWMSWIGGAEGVDVPSMADAFYLAGYVLSFVVLFNLVHRHAGDGARTASIDSAIVSTAIGIAVWIVVVQPVAHDAELSPLGFAVTAAYPLIDVAMFGLAVTILLQPGRQPIAVKFIVGALACTYLSDVAWTYLASTGEYVEATAVDLGWWLGPLFWGAAGLHSSMSQFGERRSLPAASVSRWRLLALGVAASIGPLLMILKSAELEPVDVLLVELFAIALAWLVVLRLGGTLDALAQSLVKRTELQGELSRQASHDPLTGLVNRRAFADRLADVLAADAAPPAVLLVDLDDFKAVNDSHGHQTGDGLLVLVAERLRATLRVGDLAGRLGGDEFGVLLEDCPDERTAGEVAQRLLDSLDEPFEVDGQVLFAHASVGIAVAGVDSPNADALLRDADIAKYLAKGQGKGRFETYQPTMHASILQRLALRADLQQAIAGEQFVLQYQPIFRIEDNRLMGVEALIRWRHPERGVLDPGQFIGLAEETGLIVPLGRWVLREACRQLAEWRAVHANARTLSMTVNVSAVQLEHPAFVGHLRQALQATGIPPASLVLELTESVLTDSDASVRVLEDLKAIGVRIAIDDFGTGYSSLSYVGRFPIDILKIDRSFIAALGGTTKEAALTATIVELADNLDLLTVAEGIEDAGQLSALRRIGCRLGQGFFLARPLQPGLVGVLIGQQRGAQLATLAYGSNGSGRASARTHASSGAGGKRATP